MSHDKTLDNRILSKITFITCLGDFLSFFAILQILSSLGSSVAVSAFSVVVKSFAIGVGGVLLPVKWHILLDKNPTFFLW